MLNRKLKNYTKYMDKLRLFAQAMNIRIEYGELDSEGIWMPAIRKIKLDDDDLSQSFELAALLHELGHSMDDLISSKKAHSDKVFNAYEAVYTGKASKKQRNTVLECEKRAWKNGRDIAYRLKINLGAWYESAEQFCLESYKKVD